MCLQNCFTTERNFVFIKCIMCGYGWDIGSVGGEGGGGGELSVHCFFYHSTLLLVVYHYEYLLQDAVRHCVGTCVCVCLVSI